MRTDELFVGIDSGTQGTKVVVFSRERSRILCEGTASHPLIENSRGGREQDPEDWFQALDAAITTAIDNPVVHRAMIRGIAVSGQQHGFVPLDRDGCVIRPAKL